MNTGYYANLTVLPDGDLEISLTDNAFEEKEDFLSKPTIVALINLLEDLLGNGWHLIDPENLAALTDSPIISDDVSFSDTGEIALDLQ